MGGLFGVVSVTGFSPATIGCVTVPFSKITSLSFTVCDTVTA